jgi:hypothetical protein
MHPTKFSAVFDGFSATGPGAPTGADLLVGKSIIATRAGEIYKFECGAGLSSEEMKALDAKFNKSHLVDDAGILPNKAVRLNEEWVIDAAQFAKEIVQNFPLIVNVQRSSGTARLVKAYKRDDAQFGIIELRATIRFNPALAVANGVSVDDDSKMEMTGTVDMCIDASHLYAEMKSKQLLDLRMRGPLGTVNLHSEGEVNTSEQQINK